jgi:hypothetical protein
VSEVGVLMGWIGGAMFVLGLAQVGMALHDRNREPGERKFTTLPGMSLIAAVGYALTGLAILLLNLRR